LRHQELVLGTGFGNWAINSKSRYRERPVGGDIYIRTLFTERGKRWVIRELSWFFATSGAGFRN